MPRSVQLLSSGHNNGQFLGEPGKQVGCALSPHDQGVLDPDTAPIGQIDTWLHGDRRASKQCTGGGGADSRRFVDLQPDPVPEAVAEVLGVAGVGDDLARCGVDST